MPRVDAGVPAWEVPGEDMLLSREGEPAWLSSAALSRQAVKASAATRSMPTLIGDNAGAWSDTRTPSNPRLRLCKLHAARLRTSSPWSDGARAAALLSPGSEEERAAAALGPGKGCGAGIKAGDLLLG